MKRFLKCVWLILLAGALLLFLTERWLITSWGSLGADEIIYHIKAPLTGTNTEIIWKLILQFLLPGFLILAVLTAVYILSHSNRLKKGLMIGSVAAFFLMLGFIVYDLQVQTGLPETVAYEILGLGKNSDDFFEQEYVDAGQQDLKFPEKKRNLIYIFLESAEITYADTENGGAFAQNCLPNLTKLAEENEDFSGADPKLNGGYVLSGTDWTTGAMFAQSSGMPLKLPIRTDFENGSSLFPGLTTLGDILQKEGYNRRLLLGSDIKFGGREGYYRGHGNYEIHDYVYALENGLIPEDYYVWWGYEDEILFNLAKYELLTMQEPFCYTMLTVDTHFDDWYVCRM
ncbi:MAG: phosphoglycerol transferase, partial [Lachnospiraceae bacterium]|nr:phosphoglycerol transferase [Lachnospiraceae bacterium]